ncbi:DegV family protein [bacterium]|nr:DegV family protein [bacterium]
MPKIAFVTDTNSSLPADVVEKYGIITVPIRIQFSEETYTTGLDIDDKLLFELIDERNVLPTTAAPSPSAFTDAFQQAFDGGADQIICITCSSKVSATCDAAQMAAKDFPGKDITIVDSLQLSLAEGYQVLVGAEMAAAGADKEAILAAIDDLKPHLHVYAALPTLKYLAMGGRVGKLAAGFGNTLNIKPILTAQDGKLDLLEKVRTWRKARERLVNLALECTDGTTVKRIGMIHVNNEDGVRGLHENLKDALDVDHDPLVADFTPGLSVHAGSGVIGFVLITE